MTTFEAKPTEAKGNTGNMRNCMKCRFNKRISIMGIPAMECKARGANPDNCKCFVPKEREKE